MERKHGQMHIQGLLIDKDDTLIKIEPFWCKPIHKLAEMTAADMGYYKDKDLIYELEKSVGFIDGALVPESIVVSGTNEDIFTRWKQVTLNKGIKTILFDSLKYKKLFLDRLSDLCYMYGEVESYEEIGCLLKELRDKGVIIGVVTSDSLNMTLHCLKQLNIKEFISDVYTADKYKPKPNHDVATIFSQKHGINPNNIVMVGDSKNDMLFARNSGIHGIQIAYNNRNSISEYAEVQIKSLSEIISL